LIASEPTLPSTTEDGSKPAVPDEIDWSQHLDLLEVSRVVPDLPCSNYVLPQPFDPACALVDGDKSLVLLGDSHAASLAPAFIDVAKQFEWGLVLASQPRCPLVPSITVLICGTSYEACAQWVREVLSDIELNEARTAAVIVTARSSYYFPGDSIANDTVCEADIELERNPADTAEATDEWRRGLNDLAIALASHHIPLVIVQAVPELERWPSDCLARRTSRDCSVDRADVDRYAQAARRAEVAVASANPNVQLVDPLSVLCDNDRCRPTHGTTIIYRDDHHLTPEGSRLLTPIILSALSRSTSESK